MNEKRPRRLLETASARLDLPGDLVAGLSRVELLGFGSVTVEHHQGILRFGEDVLELQVPDGRLVLTGQDLTIRRMTAQELIVDGRFSALELREDAG